MTYNEALTESNELKGYYENGSLLHYYERLSALYWAVCRKTIRQCNCPDKYTDALLEIIYRLKKSTEIMTESISRLCGGIVLQIGNKVYTNANLTDEVARKFLTDFPARKDWFSVLPPKVKTEVKATTKASKK
jgi:hypothetical protein